MMDGLKEVVRMGSELEITPEQLSDFSLSDDDS